MNKKNRDNDGYTYWAVVMPEIMDGRALALEWEKQTAQAILLTGQEMPLHKKPR